MYTNYIKISSRSISRFSIAVVANILLVVLGFAATGTAQAQAKQLIVRGSYEHINGVNMPWIINSGGSNYGHDIGPNHYTGYGYDYVGSDVDKYFADIKNMHANIVRVWLFEDMQGLDFNSNGDISGIDPTFLNNLADMVQRANNHGLALELTPFTNDIGSIAGHYPHDGGGPIKNYLTDATAQYDLIHNVIIPLAQKFNWNWGVYAYDIMNEANYAVTDGSCTWPQMHNFIYNVAQAIHGVNHSIQVTCSTDDVNSFSSSNIWNRFGGVGLNFYDFHLYSDNPQLFSLGANGPYPSINLPIVLAEYGPRTTGTDSIQNSVAGNCINQASYLGWAGASIWDYDMTGAAGLSIVSGVGNWHSCCWTLQWYSINKFGL